MVLCTYSHYSVILPARWFVFCPCILFSTPDKNDSRQHPLGSTVSRFLLHGAITRQQQEINQWEGNSLGNLAASASPRFGYDSSFKPRVAGIPLTHCTLETPFLPLTPACGRQPLCTVWSLWVLLISCGLRWSTKSLHCLLVYCWSLSLIYSKTDLSSDSLVTKVRAVLITWLL